MFNLFYHLPLKADKAATSRESSSLTPAHPTTSRSVTRKPFFQPPGGRRLLCQESPGREGVCGLPDRHDQIPGQALPGLSALTAPGVRGHCDEDTRWPD